MITKRIIPCLDVRDNRVTCIEEMHFDENGDILPVVMTHEGVAKDRL